MEFHEYANIFPTMPEDEFRELVESVKKNGLIDTIITYQGKVLDGRHRYKACIEAQIEPRLQEWNGEGGSISMFVFSKNQNRRNLNSSQRSAVAIDFMPIFAEEAKERMLAGKKMNPTPNLEEGSKGETMDKVAKMMNVGHGTVGLAAKVKKRGAPELFDAVKTGKIPVSVASEISELPKAEQEQIVREGDVKKIREKAKDIKKGRTVEKAKEEPKPSKKKEVKQQDNKYGVPFPQDCVRLTISDRKSSGIFCIAIEKPFEEVKEIVKSMFKKECERYA